ncbi:MAG: hypothetical protein WCB11_18805 [Terriglobales bacterium]
MVPTNALAVTDRSLARSRLPVTNLANFLESRFWDNFRFAGNLGVSHGVFPQHKFAGIYDRSDTPAIA